MTSPRVLLLIPPGWNYVWQPHLNLPSLAAYLREYGCDVRQGDLNLALVESMSESAGAEPWHARMVSAFRKLDDRTALDPEEQMRYLTLAWAACQTTDTFASNLRKAMESLRNPTSYYHLPSCARHSALVNRIWEMVWASLEQGSPEERVATLRAWLEQTDNPFLPFLQHQLNDLLPWQPDVLVLSIYYPRQLPAALTLASLTKKADSRIFVVLEGRVPTALASLWPQQTELFEYIDGVIVGQSEQPLLSLARCRWKRGVLTLVPNLIHGHRSILHVNPRQTPLPAEALPVPDFEGLPLGRYLAPRLVLPVQAARGCFWGRCRFCTYDRERDYSVYQPRSARRLGETIERLAAKYGTAFFTFVDEAVAPDLLEQVADEILRRGLQVWWHAQTRPEKGLTQARCERLAQAGCVSLQFCFETASDALSAQMDMGLQRAERAAALAHCAQAGILTHVFVVMGLPGESREQMQETKRFVIENQEVIHGLSVERHLLGRRSLLAQDGAREFGLRADSTLLHCPGHPDYGLRPEEIDEQVRLLRQAARQRFPAFGASYFPSLLYVTHYNSRNVRNIVQRSAQLVPDGTAGLGGPLPRRRSDVVSGTFHFEIEALKRGAALGEPLARRQERPLTYVLDGSAGPVMRTTALVARVLELADGCRPPEEIAASIADTFALNEGLAAVKCRAALGLYGPMLERPLCARGEP